MPSSIDPATRWFLRHHLPIWFDIDVETKQGHRPRDGKISIREAAETIGVAYPQLRALLRYGTGAGHHVEKRVAALRYDKDITKLRDEAEKWAASTFLPGVFREESSVENVAVIGFELEQEPAKIRQAMKWVLGEIRQRGAVTEAEIRAWYANKDR